MRQAAADFEASQEAKARKLATLQKDKEFQIETEKVIRALSRLREEDPTSFKKFFDRFTYLGIYQPSMENLISRISNPNAIKVFRTFIHYCARFQVTLHRWKDSFRPVAMPPFKNTFKVRLIKGHFEPVLFEKASVPELVYEDIYANENVNVPKPLVDLVQQEIANVVEIEDLAGGSALSELEAFAYDPNKLTFIVHRSNGLFLFCLVGERVSIKNKWIPAGKTVTALQNHLYGRQKVGRRADTRRRAQALDIRRQKYPLKAGAFQLMAGSTPNQVTPRGLATGQSYLSRVGKRLKHAERDHLIDRHLGVKKV